MQKRESRKTAETADILAEIKRHRKVQEMKRFVQHGSVSTFEHCEMVTAVSLKANKILRLEADVRVLVYGAMLHDFYLYDWHAADDGSHKWHGFHHADRAMQNARHYFDVDKAVQHVIWSHMWPLNLTRIPRSREAAIVCIADKLVSVQEIFFRR